QRRERSPVVRQRLPDPLRGGNGRTIQTLDAIHDTVVLHDKTVYFDIELPDHAIQDLDGLYREFGIDTDIHYLRFDDLQLVTDLSGQLVGIVQLVEPGLQPRDAHRDMVQVFLHMLQLPGYMVVLPGRMLQLVRPGVVTTVGPRRVAGVGLGTIATVAEELLVPFFMATVFINSKHIERFF